MAIVIEDRKPNSLRIAILINRIFDTTGSIGKRYRREDAIGTPLCITFDFDSANDHCVTVRERDSRKQERVSIDSLKDYIRNFLAQENVK